MSAGGAGGGAVSGEQRRVWHLGGRGMGGAAGSSGQNTRHLQETSGGHVKRQGWGLGSDPSQPRSTMERNEV